MFENKTKRKWIEQNQTKQQNFWAQTRENADPDFDCSISDEVDAGEWGKPGHCIPILWSW